MTTKPVVKAKVTRSKPPMTLENLALERKRLEQNHSNFIRNMNIENPIDRARLHNIESEICLNALNRITLLRERHLKQRQSKSNSRLQEKDQLRKQLHTQVLKNLNS